MRIALIGAPGSGKGTQSKLIAERYRVPHISTGELLRQAAETDAKFPVEEKEAFESGLLVSDDVVRALLEERLRHKDTKRGFVIDGYPRNIPQAQSLDNLLGMLGRALQIAVYNEVSDEVLVKRNTGRLICGSCGAIFNRFYSPPCKKGVCDNCGASELNTRKEDDAKTVAIRVESYKEFITPLITYYRAQHKLRTVSAMGTVEEIHEKICAIVDLEIRPLEIDAVVTATDSQDEEVNTVIAGGQISRIAPTPESTRKAALRKKARLKPAVKKPVAVKKAAKKTSKKSEAGQVKTTATKVAAKKKTTKKTAAKTSVSKKKTAKKATSKTAVVKKKTTKKTAAKKATVKKKTAKKTAAKKAVAKNKSNKKVAAKKSAAKKKTSKKTAARKAPARKTTKKKKR
ncbi:MAG: adenylate kinase family protein [bacterium]